MKLIAVLVSIAVVVLVVVGYDLLMKAAKKQTQKLPEDLHDAFDTYQKQQTSMDNLKSKVTDQPKQSNNSKTKTQKKNGK
jgi:hypothetical protein